MIKLIIFDLDGTLLNTSYDIQRVLNATLLHFGLPQVSYEQTLAYVGNGARKLIERAVPSDRHDILQSVYSYYSKAFAACDNSLTRLYDGEEQFLVRLKQNGVRTAIITNKPQDATDGVYKKLLARFDFDFVIGQSGQYPLKPDPQSTLAVMKLLWIDKKDCLFVGDGETDVETARAAGIDCASVLWGYRSRAQLLAAGAQHFVYSFDELSGSIFDE